MTSFMISFVPAQIRENVIDEAAGLLSAAGRS